MGHIHAAAMAEYAKDALETDQPWERWEVSLGGEFMGVTGHPNWAVNCKYRRKPKTILINGHEVSEPHRTPLRVGDIYWTQNFYYGEVEIIWVGDKSDYAALKNGFIHLTKEAAQKHFDALKSFTAVESDYEN